MNFQKETHTVNGVKVAMLTAGSGEPLVFWHGAGTFTGFDFALPWASRFRVMIPFHPGWGESDDAPKLATPGDYMLHYMDLFDQLGLDRVNLVGLSMGGRFAATFAIEHGERVRKLVVIAPAGLVVPEHPLATIAEVPPEEIPRYLVHDFSVIEKYLPKGPDPAFQAARNREGMSFMRMMEAGLVGPWLERWLHRVKAPTMIVWGEKDRLVPVGQCGEWKKLIPHAHVLRVPNVGHLPMQEDPSAAAAIADFLANDIFDHAGEILVFRNLIGVLAFVSVAAAQAPPAPAPAPAKPSSGAIQQRVAPPARIMNFTAEPSSLQPGQTFTLAWLVENPSGVTIDPEPGRVTPRGSKVLTPKATTTYTLNVRGPNNTALTKTVTVTVAGTTPVNSAPSTKKELPRMADGKPDLSGVYNSGTGGGGRGGRGGAADPNDPSVPVLKPGAEKYRVVRGPQDTGLYADCMPTGVPGAYSVPYQWQIVQGRDRVVIMYEYPGIFRIIPTNLPAHPKDPDPTWMGDSIGKWDGDTLVVDVIGFNDKTELPGGFKHSEALHVVERFTRTETGDLTYSAVVEDPNVFARPWTMARSFAPRPDLDKVDEFVCEANRDYSPLFKK